MSAAFVLSSTIYLFLCGLIASKTVLYVDPPLITTAKRFVELKRGATFSIDCISEYPITWKPFEGFTEKYLLNHTQIADNDYRHQSTIQLSDITQYYVGYYFCVANSSQTDYDYSLRFSAEKRFNLIVTTGLSMIYVYVDDYLLVPSHSKDIAILRNEYLLLPCKPTKVATSVKLLVDGVAINSIETEKGFERGCLYDKSIGFLLKFSNIETIYGRTFTCMVDASFYSKSSNTINFKVTVNLPKIKSNTGLYATKGEQLTLNCSMYVPRGENFTMNWTFPNDTSSKENRPKQIRVDHPTRSGRSGLQIGFSTIYIRHARDVDRGYYECEVCVNGQRKSSDKMFIEIIDKHDDSIRINTANGIDRMEISSSIIAAVWQVGFGGYPQPEFKWLNNLNRIISSNETDKYEVKIVDNHIVLEIYFLEPKDSGYYTLTATNSKHSVDKRFQLVVKERPSVNVSKSVLVQKDELVQFVCYCDGYPLSTITWTFTPCNPTPEWPTCEPLHHMIEEKFIQTTTESAWSQKSVLTYKAAAAGRVECRAVNSEGKCSSSTLLEIVDNDKQFYIRRLGDDRGIFVGDTVTLSCEASAFTYSHLNWYLDDQLVNDSYITVKSWDTDLTFRRNITWTNIQRTNTGTYECRAIATTVDSIKTLSIYKKEQSENKTHYIEVHEGIKPVVDNSTPVEDDMKVMLGTGFSLVCNIIAAPGPDIKWSKNGGSIEADARIGFSEENRILKIEYSIIEDDGKFKCTGENNWGIAARFFNVTITNVPTIIQEKIPPWVIVVIVFVTLALLSCGLFLLKRIRRERRMRAALYSLGLENFEEGKPDSINPDLALDEQADLLPYNKSFEFPKKKLNLSDEVLGSGAFGVVVKGWAIGILSYEECTPVAVKMVKGTAGKEQIRALVTELKIMGHLGQHLNVVNLLGAVTQKIAKREIQVIVEYCRFGSVQSFLFKHRNSFIDQRNTANDSIDPTQSGSGKTGTENMEIASPGPSTSGRYVVLSNNSLQPVRASQSKFITTTDLVCWLFQVARGMEYLASRKVLHGDLAARNILLCDDNVVKICDFGLARSMYKSYNYIKKGEEPLPFKWLAIESISDQVFSTFSDVWSFGIVMWELFSLGRTPYPGMSANQDLYLKLKDGYRMDKPENATREIYDIMLHCWNDNPESRPLFNALEKRLGKLLDRKLAEHFVELNQPYVQVNANNLRQGQTDFLSIMSAPSGSALLKSGTADNIVKPNQAYLSMHPVFNRRDIADGVSNPGYVVSGGAVSNPGYVVSGRVADSKL